MRLGGRVAMRERRFGRGRPRRRDVTKKMPNVLI